MTGLGYFQNLFIEKKLMFDIDCDDIDILSSIIINILVEDYCSLVLN